MSNIETGGLGLPTNWVNISGVVVPDEDGFTVRDYFAIHASDEDVAAHMQGPLEPKQQTDMMGREMVVSAPSRRTREQARYAFADEMLKARGS